LVQGMTLGYPKKDMILLLGFQGHMLGLELALRQQQYGVGSNE